MGSNLLGDVFGWRQHLQGGNNKIVDSSSRMTFGVIIMHYYRMQKIYVVYYKALFIYVDMNIIYIFCLRPFGIHSFNVLYANHC